MSVLELHGLVVTVVAHERYETALRASLAEYTLDTSGRVPDVTVVFGPFGRPDPAEWRPAFENIAFHAYEREGAVHLDNTTSHLTISADGRRVEASEPNVGDELEAFFDNTVRTALVLALGRHGLHYLHAGAVVCGDGQRVLILGESGAGKTTTTLALLDAGASVLGDDTLLFGERDGDAMIFAFPQPFHVTPTTLAAHAGLPAGSIDARGKRDVSLNALPARRGERMGPPDVILLPMVVDASITSTVPVSVAEAFGRMLEANAAFGFGSAGSSACRALLQRLVANARAWEIRLGADALQDPGAIRRAVAGLRTDRRST